MSRFGYNLAQRVTPANRNQFVRFKVFTAATMKNGVLWMLRCVALVRTDVSEELSASFVRVTRIGELGTPLAVTSNRRSHMTMKREGSGH
jgi:hypothetical protein